jgi:hypothetical protein
MLDDEELTAQVLLEYLMGAGLTEEEANAALDAIPSEKQVKILADASEIANEEGKLTDQEFFADLVLEGVTTELDAKVEDWNANAPHGLIYFDPRLEGISAAITAFRKQQESKAILIPVKLDLGRSSSTNPGSTETGQLGLGRMGTTEQLVNFPNRVTAGQPVGTTIINQYITMPPGMSDSDVASAVQRWTRRNGSVFSLVT